MTNMFRVFQLSNRMYRDPANETISNWLRYINCPYYKHEQNLIAGEYDGEIYLRTVDKIPAGNFCSVMRKPVFGVSRPGPTQTGLCNHRIWIGV